MPQNNYGVYKENQDGTLQWVITQDPLELTEPDETEGCINNLSESDAEELAGELGEGFRVGRPKNVPHH